MSAQPDLFDQRRDEGIARAVDHADRVVDDWSAQAYRMLLAWAAGREFITEEFVTFAKPRLPAPPDNRAFGGIVRRAFKAGVLRHTHRYALDKFRSPKPVWSGRP